MSKELVQPSPEINQIYVVSDAAGWMQVASVCDDMEHVKSVARDILADKYEGPMFGFYASITSRDTVNDLIRKLRRARDRAFGADA